jgi:hypothetical protein
MDKDKPIVKLIDADEIEQNESQSDVVDCSRAIAETLTTFKNLYLDTVCEDDEDDIENIKLACELERELKYAILDSGVHIRTFLHIYITTLYREDVSPYQTSWIEFFSDDDMRVNAYRIFSAIQYDVLNLLMAKIESDIEVENGQEE